MKGLLLKDYYLIRDGMVILLLTFVAVGAGLAFLTSPWVLIVVAGATMSFQGAMTVQSDRSTQWDRFSAVLPLPRSTVVSEKYVLYLLLCALGMALGLAVGAIAAALGRAPDPEELYLYASTAVIVCLMTGSVNLPCTFVLTAGKKPGRHHPVRYPGIGPVCRRHFCAAAGDGCKAAHAHRAGPGRGPQRAVLRDLVDHRGPAAADAGQVADCQRGAKARLRRPASHEHADAFSQSEIGKVTGNPDFIRGAAALQIS